MKTIYQKYGLVATMDGHLAEIIDGNKVVWYGNVPLEATPKDIMEMYVTLNDLNHRLAGSSLRPTR